MCVCAAFVSAHPGCQTVLGNKILSNHPVSLFSFPTHQISNHSLLEPRGIILKGNTLLIEPINYCFEKQNLYARRQTAPSCSGSDRASLHCVCLHVSASPRVQHLLGVLCTSLALVNPSSPAFRVSSEIPPHRGLVTQPHG